MQLAAAQPGGGGPGGGTNGTLPLRSTALIEATFAAAAAAKSLPSYNGHQGPGPGGGPGGGGGSGGGGGGGHQIVDVMQQQPRKRRGSKVSTGPMAGEFIIQGRRSRSWTRKISVLGACV